MGGLFREEGPILPINVFNFCVTIIYTQFHVVRKRSSHTPCSVSHNYTDRRVQNISQAVAYKRFKKVINHLSKK